MALLSYMCSVHVCVGGGRVVGTSTYNLHVTELWYQLFQGMLAACCSPDPWHVWVGSGDLGATKSIYTCHPIPGTHCGPVCLAQPKPGSSSTQFLFGMLPRDNMACSGRGTATFLLGTTITSHCLWEAVWSSSCTTLVVEDSRSQSKGVIDTCQHEVWMS